MNENINALLREFKDCCENYEADRAKALNDSIVSYYKRNGLTESENFACHMYNLSLFYINSEDWSQALKHGKTALSLAKKLGNDKLYAEFSANMGIIYSYLGDKTTGLYWFQTSRRLAARRPELFTEEETAGFAVNLGSGLYETGAYEKALTSHKEALRLKKEKDDDYANILNLIGYDLEKLKRYGEALRYLNSALSVYEQLGYKGDEDYIANVSYIAGVYKKDGNFEKAMTEYEKAIFLLKKEGLGEEPFCGEIMNRAAELYSETGNDKRALDLRNAALKIFEKKLGGKNLFYANCLKEIANIYYRNYIYGMAVSYLQRELEIKSSLMSVEDREYLNDILFLAEIHDKNDQPEKASDIYEYLLENISPQNPHYKKIIFKLASRFRSLNAGGKLYRLYDKYRKAEPAASFDDFLMLAESYNG
ncbi:MAG: tetratricopeptide repeat protein [Clostridiales bacterium]|nr:tetratricopeptide repeat protein [Clostridiales bacterium]